MAIFASNVECSVSADKTVLLGKMKQKFLIPSFCFVFFLIHHECEGFSASATRKESEMFGPPASKFELGFEMKGRIIDCFYENAKEFGKIQFSFRVVTPSTPLRRNPITAWIRDPNKRTVIKFTSQRYLICQLSQLKKQVYMNSASTILATMFM